MSNLEIIDTQNEIIRLQSEVISELFRQVSNYVALEEIDSLPVVQKINRAADLRKEIEV